MKYMIVSFILGCSILAQAQNLAQLREKLYPQDQVKRTVEAQERRNLLLNLLNASAAAQQFTFLDKESLSALNSNKEFSIANFYRQVLAGGSRILLEDRKYGRPTQFDPSKFSYEIMAEVNKRNKMMCLNALENSKNKNVKSDNSYVYGSLFYLVAELEKESKVELSRAQSSTELMSVAKRELIVKIENALKAAGVSTISAKLGSIVDLKVTDGVLSKIYFSDASLDRIQAALRVGGKNVFSDTDKVSMDFQMLIGFMNGEDEAFVQIQQCLSSHLEHVAKVFSTRIEELNKGFLDDIKDIINHNILRAPRPGSDEDYLAYQEDLKLYLDGRSDKDKEYLKDVVAKVQSVLPYVNQKLQGSLATHERLNKLSTEEKNVLAALFLTVQKSEIPVDLEIPVLGENAQKSRDKAVLSSYNYYKQLNDSLYKLENYILEEKSRKDVQTLDLEMIKRGQI